MGVQPPLPKGLWPVFRYTWPRKCETSLTKVEFQDGASQTADSCNQLAETKKITVREALHAIELAENVKKRTKLDQRENKIMDQENKIKR